MGRRGDREGRGEEKGGRRKGGERIWGDGRGGGGNEGRVGREEKGMGRRGNKEGKIILERREEVRGEKIEKNFRARIDYPKTKN